MDNSKPSLANRYDAAMKKTDEVKKQETSTYFRRVIHKQQNRFFSSRSIFFNITSIVLTAGIIGGTIALLELFQLRYYTEEKQNKELAQQKNNPSIFRNSIKKDLEQERQRLEEKASHLQKDYEMKVVPLRPDYEKNETLFPTLPSPLSQPDEEDEYMEPLEQDFDDDEEAENNN